ncbi:hypothetical protein VTO42DRAFT_2231 [Malbranchea cinnamomea]
MPYRTPSRWRATSARTRFSFRAWFQAAQSTTLEAILGKLVEEDMGVSSTLLGPSDATPRAPPRRSLPLRYGSAVISKDPQALFSHHRSSTAVNVARYH